MRIIILQLLKKYFFRKVYIRWVLTFAVWSAENSATIDIQYRY